MLEDPGMISLFPGQFKLEKHHRWTEPCSQEFEGAQSSSFRVFIAGTFRSIPRPPRKVTEPSTAPVGKEGKALKPKTHQFTCALDHPTIYSWISN